MYVRNDSFIIQIEVFRHQVVSRLQLILKISEKKSKYTHIHTYMHVHVYMYICVFVHGYAFIRYFEH